MAGVEDQADARELASPGMSHVDRAARVETGAGGAEWVTRGRAAVRQLGMLWQDTASPGRAVRR
jgi:hypothetical protein